MSLSANHHQAVDEILTKLRPKLLTLHLDLSDQQINETVHVMSRILAQPKSRLAERIGPFYETTPLARWMNLTRPAINKKANTGKLLVAITSDGKRLYPTFQFDDSAGLIRGLEEVLLALQGSGVDGWTKALWLLGPQDRFNDLSVIEWLQAGHPVEPAVEEASLTSSRWAA